MFAKFRAVISDFTDYLKAGVRQAGVSIELGCRATQERVLAYAPQRVIAATGATASMPAVEGLMSHPDVLTAEALLTAGSVRNVAHLIIGGGAVGLETAEFICAAGAQATVVEIAGNLGSGLHATRLKPILAHLVAAGATLRTGMRIRCVTGRQVIMTDERGSQWQEEFDVLVVAVGRNSDRKLAQTLKSRVAVDIIGDAVRPRSICEAVAEGLAAALALE